jgi:C4-dicarboxylate-specific signal transduction histidine kinase
LVGGSSAADKRSLGRAREQLAHLERRLTITPLAGLSLSNLLHIVDTLPPQSILYVDSFREDGDGVRYRSHEAVSAIASVASAPIYSRNALLLGHGAVGGYVESLDSIGRATARLALRVLNGERPGRVTIADAAYGYAVDARQLRRWKLSSSRLPRGTRIFFEESSFWQRYRTEILATVSVVLLQSALIVALVVGRTQRTRSMREIHELNEQLSLHARELRTLIDVAPVGIAIAHDRGCIRVTANEAFARIVGSRSGSAPREGAARGTASGVSFFKGGVEIMASELPMRRAAAYAVEVRAEEIDVRHVDGTVLTLYASASPVFDVHGTIVGCVGVFLDITDRKRAELESQEHQQELAHLSRVAALGELSGALAHELKQPLAAILANTQAAQRFLARPRPNMTEVRSILGDIAQDVRRASDVIGHTSAMIKKESAPWQLTDLNEVVRNVLDLTRRELTGRGVVASALLSPELPRVLGDGVQLQQVVLNLVMNACDAMDAVPMEDRRLRIATAANNGEVELSVMDHGIGIPEESVGRVFQPFFTSKEHGLGLGLSICRSIVNAHGGRLWVVNNPTGGATFHMAAPRAPNEDHSVPAELAHFGVASTQAEPTPHTRS